MKYIYYRYDPSMWFKLTKRRLSIIGRIRNKKSFNSLHTYNRKMKFKRSITPSETHKFKKF